METVVKHFIAVILLTISTSNALCDTQQEAFDVQQEALDYVLYPCITSWAEVRAHTFGENIQQAYRRVSAEMAPWLQRIYVKVVMETQSKPVQSDRLEVYITYKRRCLADAPQRLERLTKQQRKKVI